jgi:hypothetical protein
MDMTKPISLPLYPRTATERLALWRSARDNLVAGFGKSPDVGDIGLNYEELLSLVVRAIELEERRADHDHEVRKSIAGLNIGHCFEGVIPGSNNPQPIRCYNCDAPPFITLKGRGYCEKHYPQTPSDYCNTPKE